MAKKAAKGIGILRRSKGFLDKDTLKTIYIAFLFCHILTIARWYGIIVLKLCKTNYKSFKIEPVELLQVIATKLPQIISEPNFVVTL